MPEGINDWYVRLVEDPKHVTATFVLDVVDKNGQPHPAVVHSLREIVKGDGQ